MDKINTADLQRTPFVEQKSGHWALFLIEGKALVWGIRFDSNQGYRFFVKFEDSKVGNVFSDKEAIKQATALGRIATSNEEKELSKAIRTNAIITKKLQAAWIMMGKPDAPLDQIEGIHGHA